MNLQTKYFGEIQVKETDLIKFRVGMLGFEEEHSYVLLPFEGSDGGMLCLQSTVTPTLAFVLLDPFRLLPDYEPVLRPAELKEFGVSDGKMLSYYVLCAVKSPVSSSTVNLKCPIVIHPETLQACQVILDTDAYEMRQTLVTLNSKEAGDSC